MPTLKYIKTRIQGIESTKKITQAMKIVSASSLKGAQSNIKSSGDYLRVLARLLVYFNNQNAEPLQQLIRSFKNNNESNILFIVVGTDKGLCGSFNTKITNYMDVKLQRNKNAKILCIGDKLSRYMQAYYNNSIIKCLPFFRINSNKISYNELVILMQELLPIFFNGNFSECRMVYTKYHTIVNQTVEEIVLLPLYVDEIKRMNPSDTYKKNIFEFDDNIETFFKDLTESYIKAIFWHTYTHSLTCEHSSRMLAMDGATKSSDKMLKELNLLYNRSRQSIITKELIEIISGAEATH